MGIKSFTNSKNSLEFQKLRDLDILVYLNHHAEGYNYHKKVMEAFSRFADESSDYSKQAYNRYTREGNHVENIAEYLRESADDHTEKAAIYMPLLDKLLSDGTSTIAFSVKTNNIPAVFSMEFVQYIPLHGRALTTEELLTVLEIPEVVYDALGAVRPWKLSRNFAFKVTNPGEQMTGTFHSTVLKDLKTWYNGKFYTAPEASAGRTYNIC